MDNCLQSTTDLHHNRSHLPAILTANTINTFENLCTRLNKNVPYIRLSNLTRHIRSRAKIPLAEFDSPHSFSPTISNTHQVIRNSKSYKTPPKPTHQKSRQRIWQRKSRYRANHHGQSGTSTSYLSTLRSITNASGRRRPHPPLGTFCFWQRCKTP